MRVEEEGDSSYGLEVSDAVECGSEASTLAAAKIAGASSFSSLLDNQKEQHRRTQWNRMMLMEKGAFCARSSPDG